MSETVGLEKLMNAHLEGIGRELKEIKQNQKDGFASLERKMENRDRHVDDELAKVHSRIDDVQAVSDERFASLERTMNRWGGAFALAVAVIVLGLPLVLWLLGLVVK